MARRKLENKLIDIQSIHEVIKPIPNSCGYYISNIGNVYVDYGNNKFYKLKLGPGKYGYVLVGVQYMNNGVKITKNRRVHRLVAEAFIQNDDPIHKKLVMHLDNVKTNNNVQNLKWGTTSENTKQAFNDGLEVNAKGFDDSQSKPVVMFDFNTFEKIKVYGSISQAALDIGVEKTLISSQAWHLIKHPRKQRKYKFYFRFLSEYQKYGFVL